MFRSRIKLERFPASAPVVNVLRPALDGKFSHVQEPTNQILPPVENFDLATMIKAKVDLKQVSTKLMSQNNFIIPEIQDEPQTELTV